MFGRPSPEGNGSKAPQRPAASDMARIEGGGLAQIIVTNLAPVTFSVFLNDREVPQIDVESLSVYIEAPDSAGSGGTVRATLARYVPSVTGEKSLQRTELFPCTLEMLALGRRIAITCMNADSFEGLWVYLGLRPDGSSHDLSGLKSINILLNMEILHAELTWEDGEKENLLPQ